MAGIRTENKIYEVGIYCRLSKDDGTDNESASIATQKSILTDYVKRQGWHLAKTYVDDGYSGTNFQRPSFQNMIKDIENGLINCVITKDLSRLGRNYLDCGLYLEVFFPEHNVRYIAVNDGVDTLNKSAMDITPFRNILNEMYSADVSVKIKSAYRARFQQGKFMGTTAPYGYVKDPADHNHLLIDDKVAHVVREIFDLALAGNGIAKIRKHINKQHILRPAAYAVEQGATGYERYFEDNEENRYIWSENSVRGILRSPIYAGNLAGYKRIAANMKSKKRPSKLPEEWEVIPDTHEGIVTQEEFDTVQQLMTSRRREQNAGGFENIFSGVIKCADCGYAMRAASANRRKRPDIIDCVQYTCNNYGRYGNVMCTAHSIEARDLFNAVLADINRFADMAVNDEKAVRAIERRLTETDQSRAKSLEKEKKKLNKRLAELDRLFSSLYEDKVMERITERNFEMMSGKYQKEQLEIEARLKEVTETLNDSYEKSQGVRDFLSLIRNYQGLKELDATIINALIDKILVSEREKLADGTVRQEIKIYYKFIGFVGELHITPTKRWTALKPKNCTVCGVEYVPSSGISKYCPACAKRIQREKSNESKRRSRERNRRACIELSAKNDRLMRRAGAMPVPLFMVLNDIFSRPKKFMMMILIFALGIIMINIPLSAWATLRSDEMVLMMNMTRSDGAMLRENEGIMSQTRSELERELEGIEEKLGEKGIKVHTFREVMFKFIISCGDHMVSSIGVQGIGTDTDDYLYFSGTAPKLENEIAVTSLIADKLGAGIGDTVEIAIGGEKRTFIITALYESLSNMGEGVRFSEDVVLDYTEKTGAMAVQFTFSEEADKEETRQRLKEIRDIFPEYEVMSCKEYVDDSIGGVSGILDSLSRVILIIVLAVNALIAALMVRSFIIREKGEIALLKSLGFPDRTLILWQSLRISLSLILAAVTAALLTLPLSNWIVGSVFGIMGSSEISVVLDPLMAYCVYPLTLLAVTTICSLLSALRLRKIRAREINIME